MFLEENIDIKLAESESEKNRFNKNVTLVKYLPSVNLQASYNWQKQESYFVFDPSQPARSSASETDYYRYGIQASMPLDINSFNGICSVLGTTMVLYLTPSILSLFLLKTTFCNC